MLRDTYQLWRASSLWAPIYARFDYPSGRNLGFVNKSGVEKNPKLVKFGDNCSTLRVAHGKK